MSQEGAGQVDLPSQSQMQDAIEEWSSMQKQLAPSNRQAKKFNTGSVVYDATTGEYYYGMNRGVQISGDTMNGQLVDLLPKQTLNNYRLGNCAEVDAVNQALINGAKMSDLYMYTIDVNNGNAKAMCDNCIYTFDGNVLDVLSK